MINKPLPSSCRSEQAILGIILKNQDSIAEVIGKLAASDFYFKKHGLIFESMCKLYSENISINAITLFEKYKSIIDECGGISYLMELYGGFIGNENINDYISIYKLQH